MPATAIALRIELWPVDRLVPYARNPRTHSDEQVTQIAASIVEFGFNNPILVDTRAGIIAGHGRLLAARKLGFEHVPVVILDHLTEEQKRAYIIADNKLALNAGWDEDLLKAEFAELRDADFDIGVIGSSDEELEDLLAGEPAAGLTDEDACPGPPTELLGTDFCENRVLRHARTCRTGTPGSGHVQLIHEWTRVHVSTAAEYEPRVPEVGRGQRHGATQSSILDRKHPGDRPPIDFQLQMSYDLNQTSNLGYALTSVRKEVRCRALLKWAFLLRGKEDASF